MLIRLADGWPYALNEMQFRVAKNFDGSRCTADIARLLGCDPRNVKEFALSMQRKGLLRFRKKRLDPPKAKAVTHDIRQPHLFEVHIDISSACNLKCKHCYQFPHFSGDRFQNDLGTQEIIGLIDQMHELSVVKLVISGGEPFLRSDITQIMEYAISKGIYISSLFTNGTVVNDDIIHFLAKQAWPSLIIAVSLDGDRPEIHDWLRGKGSFDKTVRFLRLLRRLKEKGARFSYIVSTMVNKKNQDRLFNIMSFLKDLGVDWWRMSMARDQGSFAINKHRLQPDKARAFRAYQKLILNIIHARRNDPSCVIRDVQIESFFRTGMLDEGILHVFRLDDPCCRYKKNAITIKPNGEVAPCTGFNRVVLGNIRKAPLKKIWYSRKTQAIKNLPIRKVRECAKCELYPFCGGGCRILAFEKTGSLYQKDSDACELYQLFQKEILPIYEREGIVFSPPPDGAIAI